LSINRLRNADGFFGKSDPYVRLSGLTGRQMIWGETKTVRDNLNPEFNNEKFVISLLSKLPMGGALSSFKIELWDEDDKKRSSSDDPLGMATLPWINLFPDPNVPKLSPLKLVDRGAKSGSTVTVSVTMPKKSLELQQNLAGVGRSLLQNAISLTPSANQGGGGGGIPITKPPIKIAKSSCKANLAKGLGFKIADCTDNIADRYTIGLAWDVTNGVDIDLDASCVWLDSNLQPIDTVWFQKLRSADGSMQHCGDEREGDAVGDDESIMFDLERVSPRATYLCFCINSFTGQLLSNVASAKCRMYNTLTLNEIASFDLTNNDQMNSTALLMCILYRNQGINSNGQEWFFYAVGESADGRTVQDNIDEFQVFLTKHPLSKLSQSNQMISKPPQIAKIKVPPNTGSNNTIGFKLPSGASEQVKLPPSAQAGDVVEVPLIDVFAVE
jgi:tellurium resistance protein TerZ